jgi:putative oxidoreductase
MKIKNIVLNLWNYFNLFFEKLQPLGDLFIRCWVAKAFIASGLTKTLSWSSTLILFKYEYMTPFLTPAVAASIAVTVELGISSLLILGIGGRLPALILFLFNIIAVVSYPVLLTKAGAVGLKDHICWGIILLVILLHGTGKISLDHAIWLYRNRNKKSKQGM